MRRIVLLLLSAYLSFLPTSLIADVIISSGVIDSDTTWSSGNGVYIINGNVTVTNRANLTIEPGVVVKFHPSSNLNFFEANLNVMGQAGSPVYFTSIYNDAIGGDTNGDGGSTTPSINDYWGLNIVSSDSSIFTHTHISYSYGGVFVSDSIVDMENVQVTHSEAGVSGSNSEINIANSHFSDIDGDGISGYSNSSLHVSNVLIEWISSGDALALYDGSEMNLTDSQIRDISTGSALGLYGSKANVSNSVFSGGLDDGVELYHSSYGGESSIYILDSVIENYFDIGLSSSNSSISATGNIFRNNGHSGVSIYGFDQSHNFSGNTFLDNGIYALEVYNTSQVKANENWWGHPSGPYEFTNNLTGLGGEIYGNINFAPWLLSDPFVTSSRNPVIIIPGIMGSAYKNNNLVIDPILGTYDDLIETLVVNGYEDGVNLFTFPYEWRESNVLTASFLRNKISQIKAACGCEKVDIVAHSMGGLVARYYIQSDNYADDIDQIIFLGTPHNGSPKDYLIWDGGSFPPDFFSNLLELFFTVEAIKNGYSTLFDYVRGKPIHSVQQLLPTFDYIKDKDSGLIRSYPENYPRNNFLENLNDNVSSLVNSGVRITNIFGVTSEANTINVIRVVDSNDVFWEHGKPDGFGTLFGDDGLERGLGDDTVTLYGVTIPNFTSSNKEVSSSHQMIPTVAANLIFKILTGKDSSVTITADSNSINKILLVQLQSPIDVSITAPDGKRIGKNFETGGEYDEVPSAFYSGSMAEYEYITILNPLDGKYVVEIQGIDNGGEYGVWASYIDEKASVTKEIYGLTETDQITSLNIVVDNNPETFTSEKHVTPEVLLNNIIKAYELGWITDKRIRDSLVRQVESVIKIESKIEQIQSKNKKNKDKKTARLELRVDKKLVKALLVELKAYKKDKMNEQAYNIIKGDLEWLINN